jgi:hypothetical protein
MKFWPNYHVLFYFARDRKKGQKLTDSSHIAWLKGQWYEWPASYTLIHITKPLADCSFNGGFLSYIFFSYSVLVSFPTPHDCLYWGDWRGGFFFRVLGPVHCVGSLCRWPVLPSLLVVVQMLYGINSMLLTVQWAQYIAPAISTAPLQFFANFLC